MPVDREPMASRLHRLLGSDLRVVRRSRGRLAVPEAASGGPSPRRTPAVVPRRTRLAARLLHPRRLLPAVTRLAAYRFGEPDGDSNSPWRYAPRNVRLGGFPNASR